MTKDERIASFKYSVLEHARKNKNVTSTCKLFNITRTTYYVWLRRFSQSGYLGLLDRQRSKPSMPNHIKPEYDTIIYNYIRDYPTHGLKKNIQ